MYYSESVLLRDLYDLSIISFLYMFSLFFFKLFIMTNKKVYRIEVTYTNTSNVTASHSFTVLAETKHEAIQRAIARYYDVQPNQEGYKVISGWDYNTAKAIGFLAMQAFHYSMDFS